MDTEKICSLQVKSVLGGSDQVLLSLSLGSDVAKEGWVSLWLCCHLSAAGSVSLCNVEKQSRFN